MIDYARPVTVDSYLVVEGQGGHRKLSVLGGSFTAKVEKRGRATYVLDVEVPRFIDGVDLAPLHPTDLLAPCGQTIQLFWELQQGSEALQRGTPICRIETVEDTTSSLRLTAYGYLSRLADSLVAVPEQYAQSQRASGVVSKILADVGVEVAVDRRVPKSNIPTGWIASSKRDTSVDELLEAIPARLRETQHGAVLLPVLDDVENVELHLHDGVDGTVVNVPTVWDRNRRPNHVIVRGKNSAGESIICEATETLGPYAPSKYGIVSVESKNDAITSYAHGQIAAQNLLRSYAREVQVLKVQAATDWRVDLDKAIEVKKGGRIWWGVVTGYEMPATGLETMNIEVSTA